MQLTTKLFQVEIFNKKLFEDELFNFYYCLICDFVHGIYYVPDVVS
jgi:hypothetical protein